MNNIITVGEDTAIPACFIAVVSVEKEPVVHGWAVKIFMTDGLPALYQSFPTEKEAQEVFGQVVQNLEAYYDE